MPLYDHFHGKLSRRPWESFHAQWACAIADELNRTLPRHFMADAYLKLGKLAFADELKSEPFIVVEREIDENKDESEFDFPALQSVPKSRIMPAYFPTEVKVDVRNLNRAHSVLGVIELVTPENKANHDAQRTFAGKCMSYLSRGIGLILIDIVTEPVSNLHNTLAKLVSLDSGYEMPMSPPIYTSAYRPVTRQNRTMIDVWSWELAIGSSLPIVPLALKESGTITVNLEANYLEACQRSRIPE